MLGTALFGVGGLTAFLGGGTLASAFTTGLTTFSTSFVSNAIIAGINGDFDLSRILTSAAVTGLTAGLTAGVTGMVSAALQPQVGEIPGSNWLGTSVTPTGPPAYNLANVLSGAVRAQDLEMILTSGAIRTLINAPISAGVNSLLTGADFGRGLIASLGSNFASNVLQPGLMFEVGELGAGHVIEGVTFEDGSLVRSLLHAGVGALGGLIMGGGRGALGGALGAGLSELIVPNIGPSLNLSQDGERTLSQLIGGIGSLIAGDGSMSGATSAVNGFDYNRMLHPAERARLTELAGGDSEEEARLQAAACYLVRCAEGVPVGDQSYAKLRALQIAGAQYADEVALLRSQTTTVTVPGGMTEFGPYPEQEVQAALFNYNLSERIADVCSSGTSCTRVAGGIMVAGGAATIAAGYGSCLQSAGAGCALALMVGSDLTATGTVMMTGRGAVPLGEQVLQSFGLTQTQASLLYATLGIAPSLVGGTRVGVGLTVEELAAGFNTPASGRQIIATYSGTNRGPLSEDIVNTFRSGTYSEVIVNEPTVLYRVISDNGNPAGAFWTRTRPSGPLQSVIDSALDQNWGNSATRIVEMDIPVGTRLFEGVAAQQRGLVGGGSQIYFDRTINPLNTDWIRR